MQVLTVTLKDDPPARNDSQLETIGQLKVLFKQWRQEIRNTLHIKNTDNQQLPSVYQQLPRVE